MTTTAIIPARAGSTRLPSKNMLDFNGEPLLLRKVRQLLRVVDMVIVWSDNEDWLAQAREAGAQGIARTGEWADERSHPFGERVAHICSQVVADVILWAPCTSPLVESYDYMAALEMFKLVEPHGYDSIMSVYPFRRYLWDDNGPINYKLGVEHVRSQDLPKLYFVADAIQIARREDMIKWRYFSGPRPFKYVLSKRSAVDIDDELDMKCARAWV